MDPLLLQLIRGAVTTVAGTVLTKSIATRPTDSAVATQVVNQLKNDPIFINETNSESPVESRIFWGSLAAGFSGMAILVGQFGACSFDVVCYSANWAVIGPAFGAVSGALYALYGRFKSGLKPLGSGSVPSNADPVPEKVPVTVASGKP